MLENLSSLTYQFWSVHKQQVTTSFKYSNNVSSQEVQTRIEIIILDWLGQLFTSSTLHVSFLCSERSCGFDLSTGVNRLSEPSTKLLRLPKNAASIAHILQVLRISYSLLQSGTKATKREVFYMCPGLFGTQRCSDKAIENGSNLLEVPRNRLNIIGAGKGLVSGSLNYTEAGIDTCVGNRVLKIPLDMDEISDLKTTADFLLIVEKETVLNRLVQEKMFEEVHCIAVTGCGYPDMQTREFVKRIVDEFSWIPVLVLTDYDPHGFKILCTYTFGSAKMCGECDSLAVPFAHWLGVHGGEGFVNLPLNGRDYKMIQKLAGLVQLNLPPSNYQNKRLGMWRLELEEMARNGVKFEIEGAWEGRLSEYVSEKVRSGGWI